LSDIVEIFVDGACGGNPSPGGWAALVRTKGSEYMLTGSEPDTTHNQMELTAATEALESLKGPSEGRLHSDSQLVITGVNVLIEN